MSFRFSVPQKEEALNGVKLFVLDMDGTVYISDSLIKFLFLL